MDGYYANEKMLWSATAVEISSCWINQLGTTCDDEEVRSFITSLGVPEHHKVYGCVALGYASPETRLKEKVLHQNTITIVR